MNKFDGNSEKSTETGALRSFGRQIDIGALMSLGVPDLRAITENGTVIGVRGQSLSCRRNRQHLQAVKEAGIATVIDLRTGDYRDDLLSACELIGLEYCHIPIDKKHTPPAEIIKSLPLLTDRISRHSFYISCMQGLHRTDTALALYYLFSPKAQEPPLMYGHVTGGVFKCSEIYGRAGSVYHSLTKADKESLDWDEAFDKSFTERKKLMTAAQEKLKT